MQSLSTVTSKGQITIPVEIRRSLNIEPGDRVIVEEREGGVFLRTPESVVEQTAGILNAFVPARPFTPRDEREAFGQALAEDNAG